MQRSKTFLRKVKWNMKAIINGIIGKDLVSNYYRRKDGKRCLLIYIVQPFKGVDNAYHQNYWQAKELVRILNEMGYIVDIANYQNPYIKLSKKYDLIIGLIPRGIDIYSKHKKTNAKQIAYLTSSNLEFTNNSEQIRLEELYRRKGIRLRPKRQSGIITKEIEKFDGALFFGNNYNLNSYNCFKMPPTYFIKNHGELMEYDICFSKKKSINFLFFGSVGKVHKGLDLLLDVFSKDQFPCHLYVCGGFNGEEDFFEAYKNELTECDNIHLCGWVDVKSDMFKNLAEICAYQILPSCAEGQAGTVVSTMAAGIIPIVSKECGYDSDEVILLPDCKIETITKYILEYSKCDNEWIEKKGLECIEIVKKNHSRLSFSNSIREGLLNILE